MAQRHCLDVSQLACPEPLEAVLEHLGQLKQGEFLHVTTRRDPALLYPMLEKRGFDYLACPDEHICCGILIWRLGDRAAESAARALLSTSDTA